jgi:hypothetical protein
LKGGGVERKRKKVIERDAISNIWADVKDEKPDDLPQE